MGRRSNKQYSTVRLICSVLWGLLINNYVVQGQKIRTPLRGSTVARSLEYELDNGLRKKSKKTDYPTFSPSEVPSVGPTDSFWTSDDMPSNIGPPVDVSEPVPSANANDLVPPFFAPAVPPNSDPNEPRLPPTSEPVTPTNGMPVQPTFQPVGPPATSPNQMPTDTPQSPPNTSPHGPPNQIPTDAPQDAPNSSPVGPPNQTPTDAPQNAPVANPVGPPNQAPTESPQGMPVAPPNQAPTDAPQNAPIENPVGPPNQAPTDAPQGTSPNGPIGQPNLAPTDAPQNAPIENPVGPPNQAPTDAPEGTSPNGPVGPPNQAPTDAPQTAPIENPVGPPNQAPTDAPQGSPTNGSVGPPNQAPTDSPQNAPVGNPVGSPNQAPAGAPQAPPNSSPVGPPNPSPTDGPEDPPTPKPVGSPTPSPTISPSFSSIPSSEPTPVHPSCVAAQNGEVYATSDSIVVTYEYEVLTGVDRILNDVVEAVDEGFQGFLAKSLVDCSLGSNSDIQGVSPGPQDTFAGGSCEGIAFFDPATDVCYKIDGSVEVYLSATSTLTSLEIQDLVWSALRKEINENRRKLEDTIQRYLLSSLIDEEKGIIALYFASGADDADSLSGGVLNANDLGDNQNGVGSAISAALVGISIFVIAVLGLIFIHRRRSEDDETYNQDTTFDRSRAATLEGPDSSPVLVGARPKTYPPHRLQPAFSPVLEVSESERGSTMSGASPLSTYEYRDSHTPTNDQTQVSYAWSQLGSSMVLTTDHVLQKSYSGSNTSPGTLPSVAEKYERSATISPGLSTLGSPSMEGTSLQNRTPKTPSSQSPSRALTPTSSNTTPSKSLARKTASLSHCISGSSSEREARVEAKARRKFGTSSGEHSGSDTGSSSTSSPSSDSGESSNSTKTDGADILRWTNGVQSSPEVDKSSSSGSSRGFSIDHTGIVKPIPVRPVRPAGLAVRPKIGTALSRSAHKKSAAMPGFGDKENETPTASNTTLFNRNFEKPWFAARSTNIRAVESQNKLGTTKSPAGLRPRTSYETRKAGVPTATSGNHCEKPKTDTLDDSFLRMKHYIHSTDAFDLEMGRSTPPEARPPFTSSGREMIEASGGPHRQASPSTKTDQQTAERAQQSSRRGRSRTRSRTPVKLAGAHNPATDGTPAQSRTPDTRKEYTRRSSRSKTPDTRTELIQRSSSKTPDTRKEYIRRNSRSKTPDKRKQYSTTTPGSLAFSSNGSNGKTHTPSTPGSGRDPYANTPVGVSMAATSMSSVSPAVLRYSEVSSASKGAYESSTVQF